MEASWKIVILLLSISLMILNLFFHMSAFSLMLIFEKKKTLQDMRNVIRQSITMIQLHGFFWLPLAIHSHWSSLLASSLDGIQCLHRADEPKFLLDGLHWCVHMWKSIGKCFLGVCPYFFYMSYLDTLRWSRWPYSCCKRHPTKVKNELHY